MIHIAKKTNIQDESTYFETNKNKLPLIDLGDEIFTEKTEPLLHTNARFWIIKKGSALVNIQGEDVEIKKGERIGQAIFQKYLVTDNDIAQGERTGGFGSTNKQL